MELVLIIFVAFLAFCRAEERLNPFILPCEEEYVKSCIVFDIRYNPCGSGDYCTFIRGENASITFNFRPNFSAAKLKFGIFGLLPGGRIIDIVNIDSAYTCSITSCPTRAGLPQTLSVSQEVQTMFSKGLYNTKVKVWNEEDESQVCCYRTNVILDDH